MADVDVTLKKCVSCGACKPLIDYYRDKLQADGLYRRCKSCHIVATKKYAESNPALTAARAIAWKKANPDKVKAIDKKSYDKHAVTHRAVARVSSAKARAADPEKTRAAVRASSAKADPEIKIAYAIAYYEANKTSIKSRIYERSERLKVELRPYHARVAMHRVARKKSATPVWADQVKIQSFYDLSAQLTRDTGIKHHVDHQVPLQGRKVCGLHVEHNLCVITGSENMSKGNRFNDWV